MLTLCNNDFERENYMSILTKMLMLIISIYIQSATGYIFVDVEYDILMRKIILISIWRKIKDDRD
jgi:hypothetical protein